MNPPILSLGDFFPSRVSFKNQQRAQTQRRRDKKKERKHKFCEDKGFYTCREKTKHQRDIKKLEKKGAHINSAYFQHAVRFDEKKEKRRRKREKRVFE